MKTKWYKKMALTVPALAIMALAGCGNHSTSNSSGSSSASTTKPPLPPLILTETNASAAPGVNEAVKSAAEAATNVPALPNVVNTNEPTGTNP